MEDCEELYLDLTLGNHPDNVIFNRDIETAKKLVGRSIWINQGSVGLSLELITSNSAISFPLANGEELKVTEVVLERYGHARGSGAFFLKASKSSGEEGLIKYNTRYFFLAKQETPQIQNINSTVEFDVKNYCKRVSSAAGGSYQIENACRNLEKAAQDSYGVRILPVEIRQYCNKVGAAAGGSFSIANACATQELQSKNQLAP